MKSEMRNESMVEGGISKGRLWTAWFMSGIVVLFMLMDGIGKIVGPVQVVNAMHDIGFSEEDLKTIGILGLLSTFLYSVPRTRFLGALLLTGYLGGAIAAHLRVDHPLFTHVLFPVYLAILAWGGVWLRDKRLQFWN